MNNPARQFLQQDPLAEGAVLSLRRVSKAFKQAGRTLVIFKNLDLKIDPGEIVALVGQSGSGKTTLLQIAGLLDRPSAGSVVLNSREASQMSEIERTQTRNHDIGFVYQFHHLLPEFTALENAAMPLIIAGAKKPYAFEKSFHLLASLGLSDRVDHRPSMLSGGEQQRVAIARALVNEPKLLLADEPTGNLDPETSAEVFEILMDQVRNRQIGALIATHNLQLADQMDRGLELKGGNIYPF